MSSSPPPPPSASSYSDKSSRSYQPLSGVDYDAKSASDKFRSRAPKNKLLLRSLPPKTTISSLIMLTLGLIFLVCGLNVYLNGRKSSSSRGLSMIGLGCLLFTPGSYAVLVLYGSWKGWRGYSYSQIPSYDDEDD